jgi:hypothetical protein
MIAADDRRALDELDSRLRVVLPEEYQETYERIQPKPMRSAGLKYADDGRVAWDRIWGSFCDLAMAGGPPHKGTLLEPGARAGIDAAPDRYRAVVDEICRGVSLSTQMPADPAADPGWIRVECYGGAMAGWLIRAITMENVAVRASGASVDLPASPAFRLDKEIKNVVTVIAKTSHYWLGHMPRWQQRAIATLFRTLDADMPLITPAADIDEPRAADGRPAVEALSDRVREGTGLRPSHHRYTGWLGLDCPSVRAAIWMMRALVVSNVLARREGITLFVPVNAALDADGTRVGDAVTRVHRLAEARGVLAD